MGIALLLQTLYSRFQWRYKKEVVLVSFLIILIVFSIRTIIRNTNWSNPVTLYTHDLPLMRPNFSVENALTYEYFKQHRVEKAIIHAERSVALYPTFVNLTNLGALYVESGNYEKGKRYYQESIDKYPNYYLPYENMALLLLKQKNIKDAELFLEKATKTFPTSKKLWFYRIVAEYQSGDKEEALGAAERYYILSRTNDSYAIYTRLQNGQSLNIEFK